MRLNIPNILSLLRLFLIPVFVVVFYLPYSWSPFAAAMVFWVAGFTDWLDGMLARKLGQTSRFGAFIDPVADKVLVAVACPPDGALQHAIQMMHLLGANISRDAIPVSGEHRRHDGIADSECNADKGQHNRTILLRQKQENCRQQRQNHKADDSN